MKKFQARIQLPLLKKLAFCFGISLTIACNMQSGRSHYVLAERFFNDHKYQAALLEFKKVVENDSKSKTAQDALFRMGMIQYLYTGQYEEAVKSFREYTFLSQETELVYEAEKNIGEILFFKLEDFKGAIDQYNRLLGKYPEAKDKDLFIFRLAKSYYGVLKFDEAVKYFYQMLQEFPHSSFAEEAFYQIGNSYYTHGDYEKAIDVFETTLVKFPKGRYGIFAEFGIAGCYEEMDQLDEAYSSYKRLRERYPSKEVIDLKIKKVEDRRKNRNR